MRTKGRSKGRTVNPNFGSMIKYLREKQGLSLKEVESMTGISASYINRLERGERENPSFTMIEQLSNSLKCDLYELLEICGDKKEKDIKLLGEIILTSDFHLADEVAIREQKEKLVAIIEEIIYCQWEDSIIDDMAEIAKLISEFKAIS